MAVSSSSRKPRDENVDDDIKLRGVLYRDIGILQVAYGGMCPVNVHHCMGGGEGGDRQERLPGIQKQKDSGGYPPLLPSVHSRRNRECEEKGTHPVGL